MGYWIAVHETRGTAITTSDEPGMCSQHHKITQPWIFRVLFRVKVHAIPGAQKDEVQHHELSHQAWTAKKHTGTHVHGEGSLGPSWTWAVSSRGFRQAVPLALPPQASRHPLGSEDVFLQDRAVLCCAVSYQWANWKWFWCKAGPELISPAELPGWMATLHWLLTHLVYELCVAPYSAVQVCPLGQIPTVILSTSCCWPAWNGWLKGRIQEVQMSAGHSPTCALPEIWSGRKACRLGFDRITEPLENKCQSELTQSHFDLNNFSMAPLEIN